MAQYLRKFQGVIGKVQTEQILRLLSQKRNTGQIRTIQEFSKELEDLMRELTSEGLTPSLKLFMAEEDEKIDSASYNFMLDRVQDDLEAAFQEANQIDQVQLSHEAIVRDVILKNLRAGVAELESKISMYEFMSDSDAGFDRAIFSTFREASGKRTLRTADVPSVTFVDPRTSELIVADQDATVELVGERLVLPHDNVTYYDIRGMRQIFDDTFPQSEIIVEPAGSSFANMIDDQKGTYWVQSLIFSDKRPQVKTQFELNLGAAKEVNFIEIEPAIRQQLVLESVLYLDVNNSFVDTEIPEQIVSRPISIRTRKITTNKLIFVFRNENRMSVNFEYQDGEISLLNQALDEPPEGLTPSIDLVAEQLDSLLSSAKIKEIIGVTLQNNEVFSGYSFTTGFDNFRVGLAGYSTRGVYVSPVMEGSLLGEMGLKAEENRPYLDVDGVKKFTDITYDLDSRVDLDDSVFFSAPDDIFLSGSIEYWVTKQDLNATGTLLQTSVFPLLPLGVSRIYHERLPLIEKTVETRAYNDIGYSMFFTNSTDGDLKVYRNGEEITEGGYWSISTDSAYRTPGTGERMVAQITIIDPSPGDIYTMSYNPIESSTKAIPADLDEVITVSGLQVVDLVGDLSARLATGKEVIFDTEAEENLDGTTRLFLSVILRRNTSDPTVSPAVEEYAMIAGVKDSGKFEE